MSRSGLNWAQLLSQLAEKIMDKPKDDYNESEPEPVVHEDSENFVDDDHQIDTDKSGQLRPRKSTSQKKFSDDGQK